jgi:tetratricopeptide (TPR) repeat protein
MKPKYLNNLIEESYSLFTRMKGGVRIAGLVALVGTIIGVCVYGCKKEGPQEAEPHQVEEVPNLAETAVDHFNRGITHYEKGEYDLAISQFTKTIEINPRLAEAYVSRGNAYDDKGEFVSNKDIGRLACLY